MSIETLHDMTLKELRQLKGLHQHEITKRTSFTRQTLINLEKGVTESPHRETIQELADHINENYDVVMRAVHNSIRARKRKEEKPDG